MNQISLRHMKDNQKGIIRAVNATGEMGRRIRDMGIVPGSEIAIQGRAPLYDPVALRIMGFTLTLRNNEADYIMVEVEPDHAMAKIGADIAITTIKSDRNREERNSPVMVAEVK